MKKTRSTKSSKPSDLGDQAGAAFLAKAATVDVEGVGEELLAAARAMSGQRAGLTWLKFHRPRGLPIPDRYFTKLRFEITNLGNLAQFGFNVGSYAFATGFNTPQILPTPSSGIYPNYFTIMSDMYGSYMTHGAKFTAISHCPAEGSANGARGYIWATIVPPLGPAPGFTALWNLLVPNTKAGFDEWSIKSKQYLIASQAAATKTDYSCSIYAKTADMFSADSDYANFSGRTLNGINTAGGGVSNPNYMIYFGQTISGPTGAGLAANDVFTDFIMDYDVEFFVPIDVGPNQSPPLERTPFFSPDLTKSDDEMTDSVLVDKVVAAIKGSKKQ